MARLLVVTSPLISHLHSTIALGRRLQTAGHQVMLASTAAARSRVTAHGVPFVELAPDGYDAWRRADGAVGWFTRLRTLGARRRRAVRALGADRFRACLRATAPDLLLIDGERHVEVITATAAGVPVALLSFFVSIWRRPGLPPPHHFVRPGGGWRGSRVVMAWLWRWLGLRKRARAWAQAVRDVGCDRVSVLRALARDVGFDVGELDPGQWLMPFTYRRLPVLSLQALEYEFPHRPRGGVHYVGPMVLAPRVEPAVSGETRARLDAIVARRRAEPGRRLVYAGFGSMFSTGPGLVRRVIAACGARGDWDLIISLGGTTVAALGPVPPNVHPFAWVPQMEVLPAADVAIVHGGSATVAECVWCGVPMLVYCGFETDMAGNAARVEHHRLGLVGDARRDTPSSVARHLDRLLGEPRFRLAVDRLQACSRAYRDRGVAERVVGTLLGRPPHAGS